MPVTGCPSREMLAAYVLGKLPVDDLQGIAGHTSRCPRCQAQLQASDTLSDALIDQIRQAPPTDPLAAEPQLASLLQTVASFPMPGSDDPSSELTRLLAPPQGPDELGRLGGYRVLKLLGAGGMGLVLQAEDPLLRRMVALKVMRPTVAADPTARQRFHQEATATAALRNDHVITIYQVGQQGDVPFLAMQLLRGETLADHLQRVNPVPVKEIVRIGREIVDGLGAAHDSGMIHRDVKPGNIWLEQERGRVKVLDFGLVRSTQAESQLTQAGLIMGTPEYMSPEQAHGMTIDARSDLFSVGVVLYELCTGRSPFGRDTAIEAMLAVVGDTPPPIQAEQPRIPEALANLVHSLLNKRPEDRPASAQVVAEELDKVKRSLTSAMPVPSRTIPTASPPSRTIPTGPSRRSGRRRVLAAGALLLMLAAAGTALIWLRPTFTTAGKATTTGEPTPTPTTNDDFVRSITALPEDKQYAAVGRKLQELNPAITELSVKADKKRVMFCADGVTDLSPLRALPNLQSLHCAGSAQDKGGLTDLSPLKDLKQLRFLACQNNQIRDLSPLKDIPLDFLKCDFDAPRDTALLKSMRSLKRINEKPVHDFWINPVARPTGREKIP